MYTLIFLRRMNLMQKFLNEIDDNIKLTYLNRNTAYRYKRLIFRFVKYNNISKEEIDSKVQEVEEL